MNRRKFTKASLTLTASLAVGRCAPDARADKEELASNEERDSSPRPFPLRGVYFHDGFTVEPKRLAPLYWRETEWRRQIEWLTACGINAIEFATMLEFLRIPSTELEKDKIVDRLKILDLAHAHEMRFGYILSNTVVSTVPEGEEPSHQLKDRAVQLCPRVPGNFEKTIALQGWYMDTYKEADFFDEFAADWGACFCGQCGVSDFVRYVHVLADRLADTNAAADMYANTWCISYWGPNPISKGWRHVFDLEISGTREVIEALPTLPNNTHLALPCHHLYRQLAYESYGGKGNTPVFPTASDVQRVHNARREVMAWPHFVMDDDAGRVPQWGLVHSEVRYIRAMLQRLQDTDIDRVMGNLYLPHLQLSNTYAFGRLTEAPQTEPIAILRDFARLAAHREDVERLTEVLCWLDNNSYWNYQLTEDAREPLLPCVLTRDTTVAALASVRPRTSPELPLPVPPEQWLEDLKRSIPRMVWAT